MKIAADKNQFVGSHGLSNASKHIQIEKAGHEIIAVPLPFGDYCLVTDAVQETIDRRGNKLKKADFTGDIKLSIDTKKDLLEVAGNICGKSHGRFRDEAILAQKCGCRLIVLVEESGIKDVRDVFKWQNPRMHRYNKIAYMHNIGKWMDIQLPKAQPTSGETLAKAMLTMSYKYGIEWMFCRKNETGKRIIELLGGDTNDICV